MKRKVTLATTMVVAGLIVLAPRTEAEAPVADQPKMTPKEYAQAELIHRGYLRNNWECLESLWQKESNWRPKADNPKSTAFGIAQMLNETSTDPMVQIDNGLRYIEHRYGNPCKAWEAWQERDKRGVGWY
jgi:resuscitation-promoting factor RpfB